MLPVAQQCTVLLSSLQWAGYTLETAPDGLTNPCVFDSGAINALAAVLQVAPIAVASYAE